MKKKILAIAFAGIALAGGLTACTSNAPTNTPTTESEKANTEVNEGYGVNTGYNEGSNTSISIPGEYEGKWCKFVGDEKQETEAEFSLILNEDGTGINKRDNREFECTWGYDKDGFKLTDKFMGLEINYTGEIKEKELHIYNGDPKDELTFEYVYEKK